MGIKPSLPCPKVDTFQNTGCQSFIFQNFFNNICLKSIICIQFGTFRIRNRNQITISVYIVEGTTSSISLTSKAS